MYNSIFRLMASRRTYQCTRSDHSLWKPRLVSIRKAITQKGPHFFASFVTIHAVLMGRSSKSKCALTVAAIAAPHDGTFLVFHVSTELNSAGSPSRLNKAGFTPCCTFDLPSNTNDPEGLGTMDMQSIANLPTHTVIETNKKKQEKARKRPLLFHRNTN